MVIDFAAFKYMINVMKKVYFIFLTGMLISESLIAQEIENKGRISGYMFGDYFYNLNRDPIVNSLSNVAFKGEEGMNGVQLRRIYFTYDYNISSRFTTRFRLEADQEANASNGKIGVFVKDAYLKWKDVFNGSDLLFGIQPTPAFEVSESYWGNRFLEKTIMDLRGIVSSRDLAVALTGRLDQQGQLKYTLMLGNGSGNRPETDKYNRYYAMLQYSPVKNFSFTFHTDLRTAPPAVDPLSLREFNGNILNYALFAGYKIKDRFSFGLEGFSMVENNKIDAAPNSEDVFEDRKGFGVSVFGTVFFSEILSSVLRYDYLDPNIRSSYKGDRRSLIIASLNVQADEKVIISPNIFIETFEKFPDGTAINSSVTPRITLFYTF
jgi:hypothetical protein